MISKQEQNDFYRRLGDKIKAKRTKLKISQEELANQLGFVSRISIVQIESGRQKIQLHTLLEISEFLNSPLLELLPPLGLKNISSKLSNIIAKEVLRETSNPKTVEQAKSFVRDSSTKLNKG